MKATTRAIIASIVLGSALFAGAGAAHADNYHLRPADNYRHAAHLTDNYRGMRPSDNYRHAARPFDNYRHVAKPADNYRHGAAPTDNYR